MKINIAIDGPAGSGKSTISKEIAKKMGIIYVDTGALYRAVGLKLVNNGVTADTEPPVAEILKDTVVTIKFVDGAQRVFLDGQDVSDLIRTQQISMMASKCSALPCVREFLLEMQRKLARENSVIMDGRDIGTVVLPAADVKIFLTASPECRAKRRFIELSEKGDNTPYQEILKTVIERDYNDSHRAIAPLKKADDAIEIDTTPIGLQESIELIYNTILQQVEKKG